MTVGAGFDRVEHMRRSVEDQWNHGDVEGFMAAFAEDAVLAPQARHLDDGPLIKGKEEITRFFEKIHRAVEFTSLVEVGVEEVLGSFRWVDSAPDGADDWMLLYRFDVAASCRPATTPMPPTPGGRPG